MYCTHIHIWRWCYLLCVCPSLPALPALLQNSQQPDWDRVYLTHRILSRINTPIKAPLLALPYGKPPLPSECSSISPASPLPPPHSPHLLSHPSISLISSLPPSFPLPSFPTLSHSHLLLFHPTCYLSLFPSPPLSISIPLSPSSPPSLPPSLLVQGRKRSSTALVTVRL